MKTRAGREIVFECDDCGDSLETNTSDWDESMDFLKDNDWKAKKVGDIWCHYCFGCQESLR